MSYLLAFLLSFTIALVTTPLVRRCAIKLGAVDKPDDARKFHAVPTPRLGGLAIGAAFLVPVLLNFELGRPLIGLLIAAGLLLLVGAIDDIKQLGPWHKLLWQVMAAGIVLAGGFGIVYFTDPTGGQIALDFWKFPVELWGFQFNLAPVANVVSIIWIVGIINAINFHDGLDGLASGVAAIAALVMFIFAVTSQVSDPFVAMLSIILLGAILGFLPYNFYPSSIFLGDSGAYLLGVLLATIAIYGSSKIAVGAVVLGFAILDGVWTILRRLINKQSPFKADRQHLHYLLHDGGLSHRQTVLTFYIITVLVSGVALVFGGAAAFATVVLILIAIFLFVKIIMPKRNS